MGTTRHTKLTKMILELKEKGDFISDDELLRSIILTCGSDRLTIKGCNSHLLFMKMIEKYGEGFKILI